MNSRQFFGWVVFYVIFFAKLGQAQPLDGLPRLFPSHIQPFQYEAFFPNYCVEKFIIGPDGRLWMPTCGALNAIFNLPLIQYDGYELRSVDIELEQLAAGQSTYFEGYVEGLGLYGCINTGWASKFFYYEPSSGLVTYVPMPEGSVGAIYAISKDQIWFFQFLQSNKIAVYFWNGTQMIRETQLDIRTYLFGDAPITPVPQKTIEIDGSIYFSGRFLGLIQYDIKAKRLKPFKENTYFPENIDPINCNRWRIYKRTPLTIRQDSIYVIHVSDRVNFAKWVPKTNQRQPLFEELDCLYHAAIYQDQLGNLLFFYQDQTKVNKGILWDTNGQYWDYTSVLEQLPAINAISGHNFFKQVLVGTIKGAYVVDIQQQKAITILSPEEATRKIMPVDTSSFLAKAPLGPWELIEGDDNIIHDAITYYASKFDYEFPAGQEFFLKNGSSYFLLIKSHIEKPETKHYIFSLEGQSPKKPVTFSTKGGNLHFPILLGGENPRITGFLTGQTKYVVLIDPFNGQIDTVKVDGKPVELGDVDVNNAVETSDGTFWLMTTNGIFRIHPDKKVFRHYKHGNGFTDYRALVLHEMPSGLLWIGTIKGGIQIFDPEKEKVVQIIDSEDGLSNNAVPGIVEDDDGDLWVGTFNGLNLVSPKGEVKTRLFKKDGLSNNEFNRLAYGKVPDGRLVFGTVEGLCIIDPKTVKKGLQSNIAQIYISELTYYDQKKGEVVTIPNYSDSGTPIELPVDRKFLRIKVAMSNYGHSEENSYSYKLEGIDNDWNYLGQQSNISLSNLPPGKYKVLISGIDERGNWAVEPIAIPLRVRDYFYKELWFYALCLLVIIAIAMAWIRLLQRQRILLRKEVANQTRQIRKDKALIEQQADELRQVDALKNRFFTNISHELRTPVTLISTPIENLIRKYSDRIDPYIQRSHQLVYQNAKKLGLLVEELLELSRIEAGEQKLSNISTPFTAFCRQLFSAFESAAKQKNIHFTLDLHVDDELHLLIDRKRLSKIINNLISNALKFTSTEGIVRVKVRPLPEEVHPESDTFWYEIQVQDSGRGIPPEDLPYIFDRYYQTKRQDLPTEGGTGIGLALSKELAQLMQGDLSVESTWGKGSTFILRFPAKHAPTDLTTHTQTDEEQPSLEPIPVISRTHIEFPNRKSDRQLLLIEDNIDMQMLLKDLLGDQYQLTMANNGLEAWELLQATPDYTANLDLIVSDVMMPIMDGYALLEKIKSTPALCQIPIIMLTARASEDSKLKALRMGVDDYLTKPFSVQELHARISSLIYNYDQRKQFFTEEKTPPVSPTFEPPIQADHRWLKALEETTMQAIEKKINLKAPSLAAMMSISERQLRRRIKATTGLPIKSYINEVKLQKARQLLEAKSFSTISEIAYACGFNTPGYFTQVYEKRFGKRPGEYLGEI